MRRVLIVEDDLTLLEVLRAAFSQTGWTVTTASTLDEGLTAWAQGRPDLVLTDKNLPGGTIVDAQAGVELIRHIRQHDREVGIVLMTAYGTAESARDTLNLGIDEYLEKPFDDLFAVIERLAKLADRVAVSAPGAGSALTVVIAARGERQDQLSALIREGDRVLHIEDPEAIRPSAQNEHADVVILDGGSFPEELTSLVVSVKTRVKNAHCVVLSQGLPLGDIKRLIELKVRALIDSPLLTDRCAIELRGVLDRLRKI